MAIVTAGLTCAPDMDPIEKISTTIVNPAVSAYSNNASPPVSLVLAMIPLMQNIKINVPNISAMICNNICSNHCVNNPGSTKRREELKRNRFLPREQG